MKRSTKLGKLPTAIKILGSLTSSFLLVVSPLYAQESASIGQKSAIKSAKVADSMLQDIVRLDDSLVVVGERGHIARSDDNGKTWQQAEVPTRAMLNAAYFVTPTEGWVVGHDELVLHTIDGGKTWSLQLDGLKFTRKRMADSIPGLEEKIKKLEADKNAVEDQLEIGHADDGASDAEDAENSGDAQAENMLADLDDKISSLQADLDDAKKALANTVANPLMDVWFRDEKTGFAVGAFGEMIKTDDGGVTWTNIAGVLDNSEHNHLNAITGSGDLMYIAGEAGHIYRSIDGGQSWALLRSPDPENGSFFAVNIISDNEVFVAGLRGVMYRSSDRGNTWKQIPETLHKNMNSVFFDGENDVLAGGNDGAFFRSRDGGRTFSANVRKDRLTIAGVTVAADGNYILVGAGGVEIVPPASL
jgi:photosystem II stability/assembly factor-like uncharacterized protein